MILSFNRGAIIAYSKMTKSKIVILLCVFSLTFTFLVGILYPDTLRINYMPDNTNKKSISKEKSKFLIIPESNCGDDPPFVVYLVTVSHSQWKERSAIRQTWGKNQHPDGKRTVAYFLLGYNTRYQSMILNESLYYKDIIQKNFTDTYHNLTLKVLMGIEWVHEFCPSVSFVMKTDSDMFVNTYYLTELLSQKNRTQLYTGFIKYNDKPIRYRLSKWYLTTKEYPQSTLPPFCSGTGYVFSGDLAGKIITVSRDIPILKLEDVYIGLCLQKLNVTPVELNSVQPFHARKVEFSICDFHKLVTSHQVSPDELLIYWKALRENSKEECWEKMEEFRWA
ncbi:beta-1,3-galactosyltransferase 5-like isoform X1 [Stegostoma tigrinum]|uniref:beta-1,3-galactosyltransferase 5-like isoform X1 n=2 Tax=Stegostoma tigrinum TaxID=3053191 RepID=UPI0028701E21|nr:beta-1,3-galactosyltransferase 5-like isoform X1 [Stegostoma tigrinum]